MRNFSFLLCPGLLFSVLFINPGCDKKLSEKEAFFYSDSRWIKDNYNRVVLLRGINLSNANKRPDPETGKFIPSWLMPDDFKLIASWGFNSVRYLISWEAVEPEPGKYNTEYIKEVAEKIGWAGDAGLLTILDMHQDIYARKFNGNGAPEWAVLDDGIPFTPREPWYMNYAAPAVQRAFDSFWTNRDGIQDHFHSAWQRVALEFSENESVVGYDILNEPFPGSNFDLTDFDMNYLQPFYEKAIASIQAVDQNHVIFIEPNAFRTNVLADAGFPSDLIFGTEAVKKIAYAPHFYDPITTAQFAYDGNIERLRSIVRAMQDDASRMRIPLWVGEWGVWEGTIQRGAAFLNDQLRTMDEVIASWSFWNYNRNPDDTMSPLNTTWFLNYIIRPQPSRIAGIPEEVSFDQDTGEFSFSYIEKKLSLPTEILVPASFSSAATLTIEPERAYEWADAPGSGLKILKVFSASNNERIRITLK